MSDGSGREWVKREKGIFIVNKSTSTEDGSIYYEHAAKI